MKRNILFLLSICVLLFSCSDKDDPIKEIEKPNVETKDPFITLKKSNIDFTNEGGSESILIESNVTWTAKSSASWCTVTPSSGNKSTASITLSAPANEDYDNRSCTVTIESGAITKTITVNQGENLGLLITQDKYELGNEESTIKVEVKANVEFEVEINDKWISKVDTRGLTTSQIEFKIAENDTYGNREGSITIKQKGGGMTSTITIFQSQEDAIILSEKDFELTSKAQSVELEIKTNIDYEVIIPEDAKVWVTNATTRALRTETVVLDITENKDHAERTAKVIVKNKKTNLQEVVTIKQAANTGLIINTDKYEVSNDGGTIEVEVKANVEFDIEISDSWISQVKTRGLKETKLQFQVAKNQDYDNREGSITIKQKGGNLSSTIKVYQSQKDAIILSEKIVDLSQEKQAIQVELKTNVEFQVIIPEAAKSWVSYTPTRGLRTENLTLNISENKDYNGRSTEIYVKDKKTNLQDTLTINQAANLGFTVSKEKFDLNNEATTIEVDVEANFDFDVKISDNWITQVETRGLTSTKLIFSIAKNTSYDSREGTITIKQKGGDLSSTIKVYQSQKDAIIISEKIFDLTSEKQAIQVELKTNVEFEVIIPEAAKSWVSYTPTRGLRTESVLLNIAENESNEVRNTKIIIKDKLSNLQETLTITQKAKGYPKEYMDFLENSYETVTHYFEIISALDALMCNLTDSNTGISPNNQVLASAFSKGYQAIHQFNNMIEEIENNSSYIKLNPFTLTSKVLRVMIYLDMAQHWGDVPFITKRFSIDNINVSRTDKMEIYNALLEDLKETSDKEMFVSQNLVNALIGMMHLELKNYSSAATYFEKTVEKNSKMFTNNKVGLVTHNPSLNIEDIAPLYNKRYMQLNYAEALLGANQLSDLLAILNKIRKEGNMELLQDLPKEPVYEIANLWKELIGAEYGYFALLKRLGIAVEVLNIREYQQLYPIPTRELELNSNMTQNPWY